MSIIGRGLSTISLIDYSHEHIQPWIVHNIINRLFSQSHCNHDRWIVHNIINRSGMACRLLMSIFSHGLSTISLIEYSHEHQWYCRSNEHNSLDCLIKTIIMHIQPWIVHNIINRLMSQPWISTVSFIDYSCIFSCGLSTVYLLMSISAMDCRLIIYRIFL